LTTASTTAAVITGISAMLTMLSTVSVIFSTAGCAGSGFAPPSASEIVSYPAFHTDSPRTYANTPVATTSRLNRTSAVIRSLRLISVRSGSSGWRSHRRKLPSGAAGAGCQLAPNDHKGRIAAAAPGSSAP